MNRRIDIMEKKDKGAEAKVAASALENFSQNTKEELTPKMARSILGYTLQDNLKKLHPSLEYDSVAVTCEEIPSTRKDVRQHQAKVEIMVDGIGGVVAPLFLEKTYIGFCLEHLISRVINNFENDFYPVLYPYMKAKDAFTKMLDDDSNLDNIEFGMMG